MKRDIIHWIEKCPSFSDLNVLDVTPVIDEWLPGFKDVSLTFRHRGQKFSGRSQARTFRLAITKAAAEATERLAVESHVNLGETSSGFAVHPNLKTAQILGRNEIIERDVFLCHFFTGTPFFDVSNSSLRDSKVESDFARRLAKVGITLKLGMMPYDRKLAVFIACAFGKKFRRPFGVALGLGCSQNTQKAIRKSVFECWANLMPIVSDLEFESTSIARIRALKKIGVDHHSDLALNLKEGSKLADMFQRRPIELVKEPDVDFIFERIKLRQTVFRGFPFFISRCKSPSLQSLFFGFSNEKNINENRLHSFLEERGIRKKITPYGKIHFLS